MRKYKGAGIALFQKQDNDYAILLGKRTIKPNKGKWSIPSGGFEKTDNSLFETAIRELQQEKVKPIFEKFHSWLLEKQQTAEILSSSKTAEANGLNPEDYLRCLFEKAPYAENQEDWQKLLPWNIEITPFKMRGEWVE